MIVLVAGMYRSGSTFAFNVIRETLETHGGVAAYAGDSLRPGMVAPGSTNVILKSHAPDALCTDLVRVGAIRCVCTFRNPMEAIASARLAFGFSLDDSLELMRHWLAWHRSVAPHCLNIDYVDIDRRPLSVILRLQRWLVGATRPLLAWRLRRTYDKRRVKDRYDALPMTDAVVDGGFTYYDRITFFHRRHVTSIQGIDAATVLSGEELHKIRTALADFLDSDGTYRPQVRVMADEARNQPRDAIAVK
jgi:hypothetical protein